MFYTGRGQGRQGSVGVLHCESARNSGECVCSTLGVCGGEFFFYTERMQDRGESVCVLQWESAGERGEGMGSTLE